MATRQHRLNEFNEGPPPPDRPLHVLCEDHNGTYVLPYLCQWHGEMLAQLRRRRNHRGHGGRLARDATATDKDSVMNNDRNRNSRPRRMGDSRQDAEALFKAVTTKPVEAPAKPRRRCRA